MRFGRQIRAVKVVAAKSSIPTNAKRAPERRACLDEILEGDAVTAQKEEMQCAFRAAGTIE